MNQQEPIYLYSLNGGIPNKDYSVVGVIDGSGSMEDCWGPLCLAWNEFIQDIQDCHCIQFDHEANIQTEATLKDQSMGGTNISLGMLKLSELLTQKNILLNKQVIIVFVTDGDGDDILADYSDELKFQFNNLHNQQYQLKFYTLAVGSSFSHQIVAELKSIIHNSNLLSSQMEYVLNPEIDFNLKFKQIREELFYPTFSIQPQVQLVPFGVHQSIITSNQVIVSKYKNITVNGVEIDLSLHPITGEILDKYVRQILAKLMEDSSRGIDVQSIAQLAFDEIQVLLEQIKVDETTHQIIGNIQENCKIIDRFIQGTLQFNKLKPVEAAKMVEGIQDKNIIQREPVKENIELEEQVLIVQLPQQIRFEKPQQKSKTLNLKTNGIRTDNYTVKSDTDILLAKEKLKSLKKRVKTKQLFPDMEGLFKKNLTCSPQLLVKLAQEKKGGAKLQQYASDYSEECVQVFDCLHASNVY